MQSLGWSHRKPIGQQVVNVHLPSHYICAQARPCAHKHTSLLLITTTAASPEQPSCSQQVLPPVVPSIQLPVPRHSLQLPVRYPARPPPQSVATHPGSQTAGGDSGVCTHRPAGGRCNTPEGTSSQHPHSGKTRPGLSSTVGPGKKGARRGKIIGEVKCWSLHCLGPFSSAIHDGL